MPHLQCIYPHFEYINVIRRQLFLGCTLFHLMSLIEIKILFSKNEITVIILCKDIGNPEKSLFHLWFIGWTHIVFTNTQLNVFKTQTFAKNNKKDDEEVFKESIFNVLVKRLMKKIKLVHKLIISKKFFN